MTDTTSYISTKKVVMSSLLFLATVGATNQIANAADSQGLARFSVMQTVNTISNTNNITKDNQSIPIEDDFFDIDYSAMPTCVSQSIKTTVISDTQGNILVSEDLFEDFDYED
jgi:hypothetical protein